MATRSDRVDLLIDKALYALSEAAPDSSTGEILSAAFTMTLRLMLAAIKAQPALRPQCVQAAQLLLLETHDPGKPN